MKRRAADVDSLNLTPVKRGRQQLSPVRSSNNIFTNFFQDYLAMYFLHGSYEIKRVPDDGNCLLNSCLLSAGSEMNCQVLRKLISASIVQKVLCLQISPLEKGSLYHQVSNLIDSLGDSLAPENVIIELLKYESGKFVYEVPDTDMDSPLNKTILDVEMKQGETNPRKSKKKSEKSEFGDKIFEHLVHEYMKDENYKLSCREVYEIVRRAVEEEDSWLGTEFLDIIAKVLKSNIHLYCPQKKIPGKYVFMQQFGEQYLKTALIAFHIFELDVNVHDTRTRYGLA
jgi:hypothetical protein